MAEFSNGFVIQVTVSKGWVRDNKGQEVDDYGQRRI